MPLWKWESDRAFEIFESLGVMPWYTSWQKVLRESQEVRVEWVVRSKQANPWLSASTCLGWEVRPACHQE